jgi:hypothetical protein
MIKTRIKNEAIKTIKMFEMLKVQRFKGSSVQILKGLKAQRFKGSKV